LPGFAHGNILAVDRQAGAQLPDAWKAVGDEAGGLAVDLAAEDVF